LGLHRPARAAGPPAAAKIGEVVSVHVIPRPHTDVELILPQGINAE
jgi:ethanolamine utilization protein EutM